jgi:hypothetical protein
MVFSAFQKRFIGFDWVCVAHDWPPPHLEILLLQSAHWLNYFEEISDWRDKVLWKSAPSQNLQNLHLPYFRNFHHYHTQSQTELMIMMSDSQTEGTVS